LASFVVHEGEPSEGLALIRHSTKASTGQRPATGLPAPSRTDTTTSSATPSRCTGSSSPSRRPHRTWPPAS
jgi:hypothetical protein